MIKVDDAEHYEETSEPSASSLGARSKRTVDELMQDHVDMLDSCMKDLGLTQGKLLRIHAKLMTGCTMFATYTANLTKSLYSADADLVSQTAKAAAKSKTPTAPAQEYDPNRIARMEDTLKRVRGSLQSSSEDPHRQSELLRCHRDISLVEPCQQIDSSRGSEARRLAWLKSSQFSAWCGLTAVMKRCYDLHERECTLMI